MKIFAIHYLHFHSEKKQHLIFMNAILSGYDIKRNAQLLTLTSQIQNIVIIVKDIPFHLELLYIGLVI